MTEICLLNGKMMEDLFTKEGMTNCDDQGRKNDGICAYRQVAIMFTERKN